MSKCITCKTRHRGTEYLCTHCLKALLREQQEINRESQELRVEERIYDKASKNQKNTY